MPRASVPRIAAAAQAVLARRIPLLLVVAGPNGAGKTTWFETQLEGRLALPFVNADRIARTLPGKAGDRQAREAFHLAEKERQERLAARESFCMETVFSDPVGAKIGFLERAQRSGYEVMLVFIGIEGAELCAARVMQRVLEGGHDVPADRIAARYPRTLANLREAIARLGSVVVMDNSNPEAPYRPVAFFLRGRLQWIDEPLPEWFRPLVMMKDRSKRED